MLANISGVISTEVKSLDRALEEAFEGISAVSKQGGSCVGIETGMRALDNVLKGMHPGEISFACSKDIKLKNDFLISVALNAAVAGTTVYLCTTEYTAAQVALRMLSIESGVPLKTLQTGCGKSDDWKALSSALNILPKRRIHLLDNTTLTAGEFSTYVQHAAGGTQGKKLLVVDSENFFSPSYAPPDCRPRGNEALYVLSALARKNNLAVLVGYLQPSDWRESERYWNSHSCIGSIVCVSKAVAPVKAIKSGVLNVKIQKNNHGPEGYVALSYNPEICLVQDLDSAAEGYEDISYEELRKMYTQ